MAEKKLRRTCALNIESLEAKQLLAADCLVGDTQAAVATEADAQVAPLALDQFTEISLPEDVPERFSTVVDVDGTTLELRLDKSSVFGENTRFLVESADGGLTEVAPGPDLSYIGTVEGFPAYTVSAILTEQGLIASVFRPGQATLVIEPTYNGSRSEHRVSEAAVDPAAFGGNHDHDGDGVPDHAPEDHPDTTGGGHPPGCGCAACCSDNLAALTPGSITPTSPVASAEPTSGSGIAAAATLPPTRVLDVLEYEIGVEIGSAALQNNYAGSTTAQRVASAMAVVQGLPGNLDSRFLHAAGIKHRLGTVIIRTGEPGNTDPFTVANGNDTAGLSAFRDYWNANPQEVGSTHDLAVYHVRASPSGLAFVNTVGSSNRYALSASNGPTSWADGTLAHEFGHSWSLGHVTSPNANGLFYESRPRNNNGSNTAGGNNFFISPMNGSGNHNIGRWATDEANRIFSVRESRRQFGDLVANPEPIRPFGHRDSILVGSDPVVVDVIANDFDFNNDVLDVELLDTVSFLGGTISLSEGTGPGGRNQVIYTPPAGGGDGDFFHYTVVDSTGRTDFGAVHVSSAFLGVDTSLDFYSYDPGTANSPVFNEAVAQAIQLTPETIGDVNWSGPVQAVDRGAGAGNAYNRDFVFGSDTTTWSHKIENGRWRVTVNMSDPSTNLDNMFVNAEGQPGLSDLDRPIGTNTTVSFEVDVVDGELNLEFGDADTVNSLWAVNRINLQQIEAFVSPLLEGDYNQDGVVNAADYTVYLDAFGQTVDAPFDGADGNGDRQINAADRAVWAANYGAELVTVPLITATQGNGEFAVDNESDVSVVGEGPGDSLTIQTSRDRAFRNLGSAGLGLSVPGWQIIRVAYNGGNAAFGVDGLYGFAQDAGTGPGQTGQAFVNSGSANVISDPINRAFTAGETLNLSYLLGSDVPGASVSSTVSFVFDAGLASERTVTMPTRSATGLTTPAIAEEITVPANANSLSVRFLIDGVEVGERSLLDSVQLDLQTASSLVSPATAAFTVDAAAESTTADTVEIATPVAVETANRVDFRYVPPSRTTRLSEPSTASREVVLANNDLSESLALLLVVNNDSEVEDGLAESLALSEQQPVDTAFETLGDDPLEDTL